jgi:hypothetical protein
VSVRAPPPGRQGFQGVKLRKSHCENHVSEECGGGRELCPKTAVAPKQRFLEPIISPDSDKHREVFFFYKKVFRSTTSLS